jgi:hypothetical protein
MRKRRCMCCCRALAVGLRTFCEPCRAIRRRIGRLHAGVQGWPGQLPADELTARRRRVEAYAAQAAARSTHEP